MQLLSRMQATDIEAIVEEAATEVSPEAQDTAARLSALMRHVFLYDRGNQLRVIEESGLSMTQCKALLELGGLGEERRAAAGRRPGRALRRLRPLDEPRGRRPGQERSSRPGSRTPTTAASAGSRSPPRARSWSTRSSPSARPASRAFAQTLTAAQRRKLDAAVDALMDREDIATDL